MYAGEEQGHPRVRLGRRIRAPNSGGCDIKIKDISNDPTSTASGRYPMLGLVRETPWPNPRASVEVTQLTAGRPTHGPPPCRSPRGGGRLCERWARRRVRLRGHHVVKDKPDTFPHPLLPSSQDPTLLLRRQPVSVPGLYFVIFCLISSGMRSYITFIRCFTFCCYLFYCVHILTYTFITMIPTRECKGPFLWVFRLGS